MTRRLNPKSTLPVVRGPQLRVSAGIGARFSAKILALVGHMIPDVERTIKAVFEADNYAGDYGMDADVGAQARIALARLTDKWEKAFGSLATDAVPIMQDQAVANSAVTVLATVRHLANEQITLNTKLITPEMREMLTASAAESTALIKRIPAKYLEDLGGSVMRSIVSGNGLHDLVPALEHHGVEIKNWAQNTALDQTRKVYTNTSAARLKKAGIKQFEWVHSGGGSHPRKLHVEMNGHIYDFDNPPFVGVMYGQEIRGLPSLLPNCRCTMRAVLNFGD